MSKTKKHTGIHEFLEQSGVLESNDESLIKKAREAYWRAYRTEFKRSVRERVREFPVQLTKQETAVIEREAESREISISQFLKKATLAYLQKTFLVIPTPELFAIEQVISKAKDTLQESGYTKCLEKVNELEARINNLIFHPQLLEDAIRKALNERPDFKDNLLTILKGYDNQE